MAPQLRIWDHRSVEPVSHHLYPPTLQNQRQRPHHATRVDPARGADNAMAPEELTAAMAVRHTITAFPKESRPAERSLPAGSATSKQRAVRRHLRLDLKASRAHRRPRVTRACPRMGMLANSLVKTAERQSLLCGGGMRAVIQYAMPAVGGPSRFVDDLC
jgi:hypothetical protein